MMEFVTVELHTPVRLCPRCAARLVNLARRRWGKALWQQMDADLFSGAETLWIMRPLPEVRIADYALPLLSKYRPQ